MKRAFYVMCALALCIGALPSRAAEPPKTTFSPPPPGTVQQSQLVYLAGEGMQSQWRAILSQKLLGASGDIKFYQWYLSIYSIDGATYRLKYQSPRDGGPLEPVKKVDSSMWMPAQSARIVGAAELMGPGVQQLVLTSHETGADCGSETVTVFRYDSKSNKIVPAVTVQNGCDLTTKIVKSSDGPASLQFTGPYYGPKAAMCCPTKNRAVATLKYSNGKWVESPKYFTVYPGAFPH